MTGAFYVAARWFLSFLPVDQAGERVFDETLADWRKEAALAVTPLAHLAVVLRGCLSSLRSVVRVSFREVTQLSGSGVPGRFLFWLILPQVASYIVFWGSGREVSSDRLLWHVVMSAFFLPGALFVASAFGRRSTRVPALGTGLVAVCVAVPLLAWAVPSANRTVGAAMEREIGMEGARIQRVEIPAPAGPGIGPRLSVAQAVVRRVWPQVPLAYYYYYFWPTAPLQDAFSTWLFPSGWPTLRWFSYFGAYLALCVTLPWLGARLRPRGRVSGVVVSAAVLWLLLYRPVWDGALSFEWLFFWFFFGLGVPWVPVFVVTIAGLCLGRVRESQIEPARLEAV